MTDSYYGQPVLNPPVWEARDIAGYLFLGGLAGASSVLAAGAELTGRSGLARPAKLGAAAAISLSLAALIHDLGRPARFLNMLRVFKVTSPMSVGTWILTGYAPFAMLAGAAEIRHLLPRRLRWVTWLLGFGARPAGLAAAVVAPAVASYTAVLLSDTATPTWHDSHRHLPFVFVGSASAAAGGLGLVTSPLDQARPARRLAVGGALL
ncbi:MAG: hypothetical protein QOD61_2528, partial [Solirubrobacteraceae bacterium]|nr:hypothetical protein [Solirubrobacteraceae bacterium]